VKEKHCIACTGEFALEGAMNLS